MESISWHALSITTGLHGFQSFSTKGDGHWLQKNTTIFTRHAIPEWLEIGSPCLASAESREISEWALFRNFAFMLTVFERFFYTFAWELDGVVLECWSRLKDHSFEFEFSDVWFGWYVMSSCTTQNAVPRLCSLQQGWSDLPGEVDTTSHGVLKCKWMMGCLFSLEAEDVEVAHCESLQAVFRGQMHGNLQAIWDYKLSVMLYPSIAAIDWQDDEVELMVNLLNCAGQSELSETIGVEMMCFWFGGSNIQHVPYQLKWLRATLVCPSSKSYTNSPLKWYVTFPLLQCCADLASFRPLDDCSPISCTEFIPHLNSSLHYVCAPNWGVGEHAQNGNEIKNGGTKKTKMLVIILEFRSTQNNIVRWMRKVMGREVVSDVEVGDSKKWIPQEMNSWTKSCWICTSVIISS